MMQSVSKSTTKQYKTSLERWIKYATENKSDCFNPSEEDVISFLTQEFKSGASYGSLNTHRSAISFISANKIGERKLIARFLKGCFRIKPTLPKYSYT